MKIIISLIISMVTLAYIATLPRTVAYRINDPSGKYTAIISYKSYLSLIPMPPGSSSDKPCYVKIIDKNINNYGEIPVDMIQNAVIDWQADGAEIPLAGEWNFKNKTCYYWSDDGNTRIYVKR